MRFCATRFFSFMFIHAVYASGSTRSPRTWKPVSVMVGKKNVTGSRFLTHDEFIGIKYATSKRFGISQAVDFNQSGAVTATRRRDIVVCPQNKANPYIWRNTSSNIFPTEDCLELYIWVPRRHGNALLPVMVFIHGGGFRTGGGDLMLYRGNHFVQEGVVYVTLNYRLGVFGFLASAQLEAEYPSTFKSNGGANGIYDQVLALKFVKNYILAFGGNPNDVTIQGESAGGLSVCTHCVIPMSRGLFQKAIIESAPCSGTWRPAEKTYAEQQAIRALTAAGYPNDIAYLRSIKFQHLNNISLLPGYYVDGKVMHINPATMWENTRFPLNPTHLMIGHNTQDTLAGWPYCMGFQVRIHGSLGFDEVATYISKYLLTAYNTKKKTQTDILHPYYHGEGWSANVTWYAVNADVCVTCPTYELANLAAARPGVHVYLYRFSGAGSRDALIPHLTPHASELPFVFGHEESVFAFSMVRSKSLGDRMRLEWTQFAKHGHPSLIWSRYNISHQIAVDFIGDTSFPMIRRRSVYDGHRHGACRDLWHSKNTQVPFLEQQSLCRSPQKFPNPGVEKFGLNCYAFESVIGQSVATMTTSIPSLGNPPCPTSPTMRTTSAGGVRSTTQSKNGEVVTFKKETHKSEKTTITKKSKFGSFVYKSKTQKSSSVYESHASTPPHFAKIYSRLFDGVNNRNKLKWMALVTTGIIYAMFIVIACVLKYKLDAFCQRKAESVANDLENEWNVIGD